MSLLGDQCSTLLLIRTQHLCNEGGVSALYGVTEPRHDGVHLVGEVVLRVYFERVVARQLVGVVGSLAGGQTRAVLWEKKGGRRVEGGHQYCSTDTWQRVTT